MRKLLGADRRRRRLTGPELPVDAGEERLDADQRVGLEVDVGGFLAVAQPARRVVDLDPAGLGEVVAAADVVGEAGADREHEIGGRKDLLAERGEVAAGDAHAERVIVK